MSYIPTPEKLQALGYALHRRKKIGDYYAHIRCRGGSGAVGYTIGVLKTGAVSLNSYKITTPNRFASIASEEEFDRILFRFGYPIQP